ncbi:RIP metalloprotease RseP [Massilia sp. TS11]|uniref:RIP metalloprotease RseP n=1 Tax=Massilia sp. TS11 TaxID=2908003 RepID=UPI001EDB2DC9|nr:RIP metalloprotease RseP [Massilia sp. TS11]MCG2584090.1 RIP metalloprotease RseP [Massilia sp. TS11]
MNLLLTVLAFVAALGPLILFHELGHYTVARLCGVKVLRFSIGMGKVVWSRRLGKDQTEWVLSALPLGGYVKMLDRRESPELALAPADEGREFTQKSVWQRIAIVAAGPLANFLLAIVLLSVIFMVGVAEPATRIRAMAENTPAWQAGLRGGDQIVSVNGHPVRVWSELRFQLVQAALEKGGARIEIERPGSGHYSYAFDSSQLATADLESDISAKLGLAIARPPAVLTKVLPDGAAARAGLREGDLIDSIDGVHMIDGLAFVETIRANPERDLTVIGIRQGSPFAVTVRPERDPKDNVGRIRTEVSLMPEMLTLPQGPFTALGHAAGKTWDTSVLTVKTIGKMLTGEVSWRNVTGPITIADYAGQSARIGLVPFLSFIAFVSISLGVMNLLPIPVLDGGLLLYYSLEVLTGRPLPERLIDLAQRAGLGLLVALMVLAVFNDVVRLL